MLALLAGVLLQACSSTGSGSAADAVVVRLYDARNDLRLELSNETNPALEDVYSEERPDAALKLAPDELMQELVVALDQLRFSELARAGAPPARPDEARGWVEVRQGNSSRSFVVPEAGATADQLGAFVKMKLLVSECYTRIGGLQFIENPQGADLLRNSRYRGRQ